MQPYFLMSLSAIGVLLVAIGGYVADSLRGIKTTQGHQGEKLVRIETVLTGANGDNGINGEVKQLRSRVDEWDRRIGDSDRRHSA